MTSTTQTKLFRSFRISSRSIRWKFLSLLLLGWIVFLGCNRGKAVTEEKGQDGPIQAQLFKLQDVKLLDSPFKANMMRDAAYLKKLDADRLLAPYRIAAGLEPKAKRYGGWESEGLDGHTLGHYLSATSMMYAATGDEWFKDRVKYIVDELALCQAQRDDGYVGGVPKGPAIFNEIKNGKIEAKPFNLNGGWVPWYNLHKTFAGLRDAYRYAGNDKAKEVLIKLSDWAVDLSSHLTDQQFQEMLKAEQGGMKEVMADVYGITGDEKYMDLSKRFNHKVVFNPLAQGVDSLEGLHANTQIPKIIGAARDFELTGSKRMFNVAEFFWKQVTQKRSYVIGGNSSEEHFGKLGHLSDRIGRATAESCNTYNMLKLTRHLMQWNPDSRYTDYYERALYNHILASQDQKKGMFAYFMSLEPGTFKTYSTPENSFWCCVGTGMENHAKYGRDIYMHSDSRLYVNLFIPSELQWGDKGVRVKQETNFPASDKTSLTISGEQPTNFTLTIRKPYWLAGSMDIQVNGKEVDANAASNGYVNIEREWQDGDQVQVSLPMKLHVETMPNDDSKVAVMYGPIVLAGQLGEKGIENPMPYAEDQKDYFEVPAVKVPDLAFGDKPVEEWIKPVDGKPLQFKTVGVGQPEDVTLVPYYQIDQQRYTVYWNRL